MLTIFSHHRLTSRILHPKHPNDYLWLNDVLQDWQKQNYQLPAPVLFDRYSIIWNPWLWKDISALDSVQRKCEKLCRLSNRRHQFDLIETYKFVNNKYKTDPQFVLFTTHRTLRGHKDKIFKPSARTDIQKQFFSQCGGFLEFIVFQDNESDTVDSFRRRLMRVVPSGEDDLSTK